ncbi:Mov34/MPN/PAD-1 family protein [Bradyrhizobium sp. CAR08]
MFAPEIENAARAHAVAEFPKESCGIVVGDQYIQIPNIAEHPEADFVMPIDTWTAHGEVEAVVHSHSQKFGPRPSASDMAHQISSDVPWGITVTDGNTATKVLWWGDFVLEQPLIGRAFVHGVTDCYSAIRAWRWQNCGIRIPDFPRDEHWWEKDLDLYNEGFGKARYRVITADEAKVGDVALINFRSKVPNHGGTLVEDGLLYHHLQNRLSSREPIGRWVPMISKWLRYEG